ncbi:MAG TPA: serine/threonine-protein kinase [Kofleriaceae bacterium]|jgi:serine/threonine-protein kinase|nr:serine/threonine-protein kinase [Kofleriaceae bacterium]
MSDGAAVPLVPPSHRLSQFGDYDIVTPLARGGMGGVYLAVHSWTRERVALKVLDPMYAGHAEIVARLQAEHALASRVRHPGIVEIRGSYWTDDRVPYLVMEYLAGETLGAIAERGPLDLPSIVSICAQAAAALAALHEVGVIHCDVKHDNLFVLDGCAGERPRVKVIDFGVSRLVDEPPCDDPSVAGTPWCIAPEQWRGQPCPASDVYALGCVLYDLTTGHPPFDGSLPELMTAHLEHRPSRPSWVRPMPIELERLILRSLAKRPADRPTMQDVAVALDELADHAASAAPAEPLVAGARRA